MLTRTRIRRIPSMGKNARSAAVEPPISLQKLHLVPATGATAKNNNRWRGKEDLISPPRPDGEQTRGYRLLDAAMGSVPWREEAEAILFDAALSSPLQGHHSEN